MRRWLVLPSTVPVSSEWRDQKKILNCLRGQAGEETLLHQIANPPFRIPFAERQLKQPDKRHLGRK